MVCLDDNVVLLTIILDFNTRFIALERVFTMPKSVVPRVSDARPGVIGVTPELPPLES